MSTPSVRQDEGERDRETEGSYKAQANRLYDSALRVSPKTCDRFMGKDSTPIARQSDFTISILRFPPRTCGKTCLETQKFVKLKNQLYDLISASRPRLVTETHEIVKLSRVIIIYIFNICFDATQLYDFVCFCHKSWAGSGNQIVKLIFQLYDSLCFHTRFATRPGREAQK